MRELRVLLLGLTLVLVLTGVPLIWLYSPDPEAGSAWLGTTHRVASTLLLNAAVVYLIVVVARRQDRWRWPHASGLVVLVFLLGFTGYLLAWDQLALYAVTVGTDIRGVLEPFSDEVKFVLLGGAEITASTYRSWVLVHLVALPLAGLAGLWLVRRRVGSRPHAPDAGTQHVRRDHAVTRHGDPQPNA